MPETLGQFQHRISKTPVGAGIDQELLIGFINDRIEAICRSRPWTRLDKQSILQTVVAYTTGTVTIAAGATSGTGVGTTFTSAMTGRLIRFAELLEIYTFTFVSTTAFTIDRALEGDDDQSAVSFRIWQPVYELPNDLGTILSLRNPTIGRDLDEYEREWLDRNAASRFSYGPPTLYVPAEDSSNDLPQIELYPGPEDAVGMPMRYQARPPLFTVEPIDTDEQFADWVSVPCVFAGVMADLHTMMREPGLAKTYEDKYDARLMDMAGEDARRMQTSTPQTADRYRAHRADRAARGRNVRNWNGNETGTWGDQ
jgi:hypothetical protein